MTRHIVQSSRGPRKTSYVELSRQMAPNEVFVGPWHDTQQDGVIFVRATATLSVSNSGTIISIFVTDDPNNATYSPANISSRTPNLAGGLTAVFAAIPFRYWRIQLNNGATAQVWNCYSTAMDFEPLGNIADLIGSNPPPPLVGVMNPLTGNAPPDNLAKSQCLLDVDGPSIYEPLYSALSVWGGAFSSTQNANLQNWSKWRTPTVFKTVSTAATGSTALWIPGAGNKFRILKFKVQVTGNASLAAAAVLVIDLLDAAATMNLTTSVFVNNAAGTGLQGFDSGWIDLGQFGIQSAAANNVLNVNLSATLATGACRVIACGTEE